MQPTETPVRVAFTSLPDLAGELVGGTVCECNDEFFAGSTNLVKREAPVFDPDAFADTGKVMDGWESQRGRRRTRPDGQACDHAIVVLGMPGEIVGVDVDTSHFLRNSPRSVELHAAELAPGADPSSPDIDWIALAPRTTVVADTRNLVPVDAVARGRRFTHVRLTIHPDGGVARLRVHGIGKPAEGVLDAGEVDLAAAANGGVTIAASDEFYGGISNLLLPGGSRRMDEGWETSRTRDRSPDEWVVVRLAAPGHVHRITVDTSHFKGNAPDSVRLEGALLGDDASRLDVAVDPIDWHLLVPDVDVSPHAAHEFEAIEGAPVVDHVQLVIEPDGGVARLRVWRGHDVTMTRDELLALCGSTQWTDLVVEHAPFHDHAALHAAADLAFDALDEADWLEAFAYHPRIGDVESLRERFAASGALSEQEQSGLAGADEDVVQALADGNAEYERRFGFVFLIRAANRSAREMLEQQRERLDNDRDTEIAAAAAQQCEITHLRIDGLPLREGD